MSTFLAALFLLAAPQAPSGNPPGGLEDLLQWLTPSYHFGDFDADGRGDVLLLDPRGPGKLFRNFPDGRFEDVTSEHGLDGLEQATVALWFDCDGDGALDLFVARAEGSCRLFQNTGSGHFVDVTEDATLHADGVIVAAESIDLDGDGALDVHLTGEFGDSVLRNLGRGRFERLALPGAAGGHLPRPAVNGAGSDEIQVQGAGAADTGVGSDPSGASVAGDPSNERLAAALLRRRAAAALLSATTAPGASPGGSAGSTQPLFAACPSSLDDAGSAGPGCITASSVPTLGSLYPLSSNLFVTTAGRVGIGTTSPGNRLQVVGGDTTLMSIVGSSLFGTWLDLANSSTGGRNWALLSAGGGNGEGAGSFAVHDHSAAGGATRMVVNTSGHVGIGTITPTSRLHVADSAGGGTWSSLTNSSSGGDTWNMISTGAASGEGAGKLLLRDADTSTIAMTLQPDGKVGLGTSSPSEQLEVRGPDVAIRVQNTNDTLGAFLGDTWSCVQLGMVNPSANPIGAVPANTKLSMFGMDSNGMVGSLTNPLGSPSFRNVLDDGSGGFQFRPPSGSAYSSAGAPIEVAPASSATFGLRSVGPTNGISGYAVSTTASGDIGVYGRSDGPGGIGVSGYATLATGIGIGVVGTTTTAAGYGVYAQGRLGSTGAKLFIQPHPTDASKEIRFACLEGNESGTYFRGSGKLSNGYAVIDVPEDFRLVSEAESLTTQVTAVGGPAFLWVESESLDRIVVRGNVDVKFHYFVNGVRRGYADFETIAENHGYVPAVRGVAYGTQHPEAIRQILVDNGILNPDFTPNEATAARLGWKLVDKDSEEASLHGHGPDTQR